MMLDQTKLKSLTCCLSNCASVFLTKHTFFCNNFIPLQDALSDPLGISSDQPLPTVGDKRISRPSVDIPPPGLNKRRPSGDLVGSPTAKRPAFAYRLVALHSWLQKHAQRIKNKINVIIHFIVLEWILLQKVIYAQTCTKNKNYECCIL